MVRLWCPPSCPGGTDDPLLDELVNAPVVDTVLASELAYGRTAVVAGYYAIHVRLAQAITEPPDPLSASAIRFV